jgi:hypothetical protein
MPPPKDKDDTYDAKAGADVIKVTAGASVTVKQLPIILIATKDTFWTKNKAGSTFAEWSTQWFTLSNCQINDDGELAYTFKTDATKKTPAGRIVRIGVWFRGEEDFFLNQGPTKSLWYQIT